MLQPSDLPVPGGDASGRSQREVTYGELQPFGVDICASWRDSDGIKSVPLHERAMEDLRVLESEGRVLLLSAPRAGHGKTHLLARVAAKIQGQAVVAGLPWQSAEGLTWAGCGRGILLDLASGVARPTALQQVCGGVLATLLRRLIQTGRIPSTDPVQALRVLSQDPMDLFTEGGNAKVIGEWFRRHFDPLRKPLAEISNLEGPEAVEDWLKGFFEYVDSGSSTACAALAGRMEKNGAAQVSRFLRLVTMWKPVVLVADHMDGLYRDAESGVAVARMALALASLPGVHVVLSMNQDLWETTFGRQLPSALEDRLSAHSVALRGLTAADAQALVALRLSEAGVGAEGQRDFLRFLDLDRFFLGRAIGSVSARGLLRHASQMWHHWLRSGVEDAEERRPANESIGFLADEPVVTSSPVSEEPAPNEASSVLGAAPGEELQKLAQHLAEDAGAKVVNLSAAPITLTSPVPFPAAPPAANVASPVPFPAAPAAVDPAPPAPFPAAPPEVTENVVPPPPSPAPVPAPELRVPDSVPPPPPQEALPPSLVVMPPPAPEAPPVEQEIKPIERPGKPAPHLVEAQTNTFHKLRQMLAKLKVATDSVPLPDTTMPVPGATGPQATAASIIAGGGGATPGTDLQARFEKLRYDIAKTTRPAAVELPVLSELVRLAGKRFPVVNYDEVELPGLLGRSLPRWSLQGTELIFGLEDFADTRYWKTVSTYVAGRLAELSAPALAGGAPSQLKLVVFKGDMEGAGLVTLLRDETIPPALRAYVDAVHLDPRSLASLYAMHQLIREAETGALQADATAVLGALAGELDFFWKRITRPKV